MNKVELKTALQELARDDPAFLGRLLDPFILRNPHPPAAAGRRLQIGESTRVSENAHVEFCSDDAVIQLGKRCHVDHFSWLRAWGSGITMGDDCTLHQYAMIQGGVKLGNGVRIGAHSIFIASEHKFDSCDEPIFTQGVEFRDIVVEDDVYIGSHVTILGGLTIGKGSILAAGTVVTTDVPCFSVMGGVPARLLRNRKTLEDNQK